jgi:uncharacterized protein (TIGR02145 family)
MKISDLLLPVLLLVGSAGLTAQVIDKDGNKYKTVQVGQQVWLSENLDVSHFRNGDPIPESETAEEWIKAGNEGKPAWCYYHRDSSNAVTIFNKLYNWYAIKDPRGLSPDGWHIPSVLDWAKLTDFLGGLDAAGNKMKSAADWDGTNQSGLGFLPGGYRNNLAAFNHAGKIGSWWSATESSAGDAWSFSLVYQSGVVSKSFDNKQVGLSVRCLKD